MKDWHDKYWSDISVVESINTYSWKLSFDMVLRKPGVHSLFKDELYKNIPQSGSELNNQNKFPNDIF